MTNLLETIKEISEVKDQDSRELVVELLMLSALPKNHEIVVTDLVSTFIDETRKIRKEVKTFDPALWAGSTAIEVIDYLITCGAIDGPIIDVNQESHKLLVGVVARNNQTEEYEKTLCNELWEYFPEAKLK